VEILVAAYFGYLAAMAIARRKVRPAILSMAILVCIFTVGTPHIMPLVYLLSGYWLPALLVSETNIRSTSITPCSERMGWKGSNGGRRGS
jgi:hypothetical protein